MTRQVLNFKIPHFVLLAFLLLSSTGYKMMFFGVNQIDFIQLILSGQNKKNPVIRSHVSNIISHARDI